MASPREKAQDGRLGAAKWAIFAVFICFIAAGFLLLVFLPKHEGELSPNERRVLASAPSFSGESILSGSFSKQVDTWLEDHFPLRSFFVSLHSYVNRYTGRNAVEDVILGDGDRLFTAPIDLDDKTIDASASKLARFIGESGLSCSSFIIPTSGYMLADVLPKLHLEYRDGELIEHFSSTVEAAAGEGYHAIDVESVLREAGDVASLYYRTDHHLTMRGSYLCYRALSEHLGFTPLDESEFTASAYEFYGTSYGKSGLFLTPPDELVTMVGAYDAQLAVTTISGSKEEEHRGSLDMSCLEDGVVDKYAAYLYSNNGITRIVNEAAPEGVLLVVKDSYANPVVPFLAAHYRTIIMLDTRQTYYAPSMPKPSELALEYGADKLVVIAGVDTACDGAFDWLR